MGERLGVGGNGFVSYDNKRFVLLVEDNLVKSYHLDFDDLYKF